MRSNNNNNDYIVIVQGMRNWNDDVAVGGNSIGGSGSGGRAHKMNVKWGKNSLLQYDDEEENDKDNDNDMYCMLCSGKSSGILFSKL